jgi:hypothetical protein
MIAPYSSFASFFPRRRSTGPGRVAPPQQNKGSEHGEAGSEIPLPALVALLHDYASEGVTERHDSQPGQHRVGDEDRPDDFENLIIPLPMEIEDKVYEREFYEDEP